VVREESRCGAEPGQQELLEQAFAGADNDGARAGFALGLNIIQPGESLTADYHYSTVK